MAEEPYREVLIPEWMKKHACVNDPEFQKEHTFTWPTDPDEKVFDVTLRLPAGVLVALHELVEEAFMANYKARKPIAALSMVVHQLNGHRGGRHEEVFRPFGDEDEDEPTQP